MHLTTHNASWQHAIARSQAWFNITLSPLFYTLEYTVLPFMAAQQRTSTACSMAPTQSQAVP